MSRTEPLDMDLLMERWSNWVTRFGKQPTKAFCSPVVAARIAQRINEETGGIFIARPNDSLCQVIGCEWFEDRTLSGEDVRFE